MKLLQLTEDEAGEIREILIIEKYRYLGKSLEEDRIADRLQTIISRIDDLGEL